ncbi:AHH domain-containing protein [Corallococcus sp. bb12-1]|uniref:AHH domain-containing protein n=1 Tax=Corallococcus sp. bb12-1 TaxID=2996784 RepID=UPI002270ECDC|nr:AHH domain-containing protein [Corallococcus sp. bb12-1]MCY1046792.1 AHH domain-containing protein [Corallococcus sp. bb12-1]
MMPRWVAVLVWVVCATGCATSRTWRLDTGEGQPREYTPRKETTPVALDGEAFGEAVRRLAPSAPMASHPRTEALRLLSPETRRPRARASLGLVALEDPRRGRVRVTHAREEGTALEAAYGRWCVRKKLTGDCLHLLEEGARLEEEGKRTLAFRIALDSVWEETAAALEGMVDAEATVVMLATTGAVYLGLWMVPEPLLSKGIAAVLTVGLIGYLGWDTVWSLIQGWRLLTEQVREAEDFEGIREAGERYGEVMGKQSARAFVTLTMAALGGTAQTLAARMTTLPGAGQAAVVGAEQGGFILAAAEQVRAVAVSSSGVVTIELSPGAVAMAAQGPTSGALTVYEHHIATNKWWEATHNGGPWSPQFQELFDRAGMSLDDAANRVGIQGHKGPHPEAYHQEVLSRLRQALGRCRSMAQCREALTARLKQLASELRTEGTQLHKWITRTE